MKLSFSLFGYRIFINGYPIKKLDRYIELKTILNTDKSLDELEVYVKEFLELGKKYNF